MLKQQEQTELLNEQLSVENQNTNSNNSSKSEELTYEKEYENTGLIVRGSPETGYFITAGQWQISPIKETPEELTELLDKKDWNLIMCIIDAMIQFSQQYPAENIRK